MSQIIRPEFQDLAPSHQLLLIAILELDASYPTSGISSEGACMVALDKKSAYNTYTVEGRKFKILVTEVE